MIDSETKQNPRLIISCKQGLDYSTNYSLAYDIRIKIFCLYFSNLFYVSLNIWHIILWHFSIEKISSLSVPGILIGVNMWSVKEKIMCQIFIGEI